ncbi:MAG: hypothetical protein ACI80V_002701 [Rhodothermales bacterium]|jgi:hypothetical protein
MLEFMRVQRLGGRRILGPHLAHLALAVRHTVASLFIPSLQNRHNRTRTASCLMGEMMSTTSRPISGLSSSESKKKPTNSRPLFEARIPTRIDGTGTTTSQMIANSSKRLNDR